MTVYFHSSIRVPSTFKPPHFTEVAIEVDKGSVRNQNVAVFESINKNG
jgi:hypothetical protein